MELYSETSRRLYSLDQNTAARMLRSQTVEPWSVRRGVILAVKMVIPPDPGPDEGYQRWSQYSATGQSEREGKSHAMHCFHQGNKVFAPHAFRRIYLTVLREATVATLR